MRSIVLSRVGNYELVRPLGAGGMAQTFVAVRRGPGGFEQKVCVKRILPELATDSALVDQFLDEASLLAHLRHANIVQVYDFGEADGSYFMALELIDGCDLDALLRFLRTEERTLPPAVTVHVVGQLLNALHHAHNAQRDGEPLHLVHRDISPSNLLLSRQGEVKLADFGIAKSRNRRHKTQAGYTKGKIAYMSPEQVRGEELDARSDLFAVGVLLHELLTGVHPFDAPTDMALLNNILTGNRTPLATLAPDLRRDLAVVVDALLATDPAGRPASAADALRLLPSLAQPFEVERQIATLVVECAVRREGVSDTTPARESASPKSTVDLPTPSPLRQSTGGRPTPYPRLTESPHDTDLTMDEFVGRRPRSGWVRALLPLGASLLLAAGGAALYPHLRRLQEDTRESVGPQGSTPDAGVQAAAPIHPRTPEEDIEPAIREPEQGRTGRASEEDSSEDAPRVRVSAQRPAFDSRAADEDAGAAKSGRGKRKGSRVLNERVAREPPSAPEAPLPASAEQPASPEPAPGTARRKHRTGISVTADEF